MNENKISVTELNNIIKNIIDGDNRLSKIAVVGELSNYKIYPSGHHYFTLKDGESSIRAVMFKGAADKLRFKPENGMNVTAMGRISVFPRDGAYQLYCTGIMPAGMGDLHLAYEQLKAKLASEGLFDPVRKKPIPTMPRKIAIITSGAGAAVQDMIRVLGARFPLAEVCVLPVRVQGVEAPAEIVGAIRYANRHHVAELIITGRGGGSIEDLWAFNDERVARAIFESELPIISAVGHEPDVTIADFVADLRAATPSNAAELAVPDKNQLYELLSAYENRAQFAVNKRLKDSRTRLADFASRPVLQNPVSYIDNRRIDLDYMQSRLVAVSERCVGAKRRDFVSLASSLEAMSPLKVFTRGFSLASTENDEIIRSVSQIGTGDTVKLRLSDGVATCKAISVSMEDKENAGK